MAKKTKQKTKKPEQTNPSCIFCKIIKGEIPSAKIYEDKQILGFLDINPANKGHALVIPKKHYETLNNMPEKETMKLIQIIQKVSQKIEKTLNPEGYNILMSNKPAAEQVIPHAHIHIIPRYTTDPFKLTWTHVRYEPEEIQQLAKKLKI